MSNATSTLSATARNPAVDFVRWFFGLNCKISIPVNGERHSSTIWGWLGVSLVFYAVCALFLLLPILGWIIAGLLSHLYTLTVLLPVLFRFSMHVPILFIPTWGWLAYAYYDLPATMPVWKKLKALSRQIYAGLEDVYGFLVTVFQNSF